MFMHHNCTQQPGYYHTVLYDLYKSVAGDIFWCTICNRIAHGHRHYKKQSFDPAVPEKGELMPTTFVGDYFGGDEECKKLGGGGWEEKIARHRRLREYAAELNTAVGEISKTEAMDELVTELWNAPFYNKTRAVKKIMNTRTWNIPNTNFPKPTVNVRTANTVVESVPWPFEGRPAMMPKLFVKPSTENATWMNNVTLQDDPPVLIQLVHRQSDGTIKVHDERIAFNTLLDGLKSTGKTGLCTLGDCTGLHYPGELQYILDHYPIPLTEEERAGLQARIDAYKTRFDTAAHHIAVVKEQLESDRAAARDMPAGGAGVGGGRRRGRKTVRRRRMHRGGMMNLVPSPGATPIFVPADAVCEYPGARKKARKTRRMRNRSRSRHNRRW